MIEWDQVAWRSLSRPEVDRASFFFLSYRFIICRKHDSRKEEAVTWKKTLPTCRKAKSWSANGVTRPRIAAHWLGDIVASWLGISCRSVILFAKKNNLAIYNTYVPMLQSCRLSLKVTYTIRILVNRFQVMKRVVWSTCVYLWLNLEDDAAPTADLTWPLAWHDVPIAFNKGERLPALDCKVMEDLACWSA